MTTLNNKYLATQTASSCTPAAVEQGNLHFAAVGATSRGGGAGFACLGPSLWRVSVVLLDSIDAVEQGDLHFAAGC